MKLNVEHYHFEELIKRGYNLDLFFLLKLINEKRDISELLKSSAKINNLYSTLKRKGLITENEDKVTTIGQELIVFMNTRKRKKLPKREDNSEFSKWWEIFPKNTGFIHRGIRFEGSRPLRINEDKCREKFDSIILSGKYKADEIIKYTDYHIKKVKEDSFRLKTNKMQFVNNSLTYLNQMAFSAFEEDVKKGYKVKESNEVVGGTDI